MSQIKVKQMLFAVSLALLPLVGFAASLGKLHVDSALNEPLNAEIELLSVADDELASIVAAIATKEAYAAQGITHAALHDTIKIDVAKNANGAPVLKLHSTQPVTTPYLDMLIQLNSASSRSQFEYTVLLDPPLVKAPADELPEILPVENSSKDVVPLSDNVPANEVDIIGSNINLPAIDKPAKIKKSQPESSYPEFSGVQELTTKRGDTLSEIAKKMQVDGVNLDQMLAALYEANKGAFSKGNMNRLKVGQIIKMPSKELLASLSAEQAKQAVRVHSANWNAYKNALAANASYVPEAQGHKKAQGESGEIAKAEDKATPIKDGSQDVVKLSSGEHEADKTEKNAAKVLESKIVALKEEATAHEKSLKESQERTAALEKQIADMQKLMAMKSQAMAEMQKRAEVLELAAKAEPAKTEIAKAELVKTEEKKVDKKKVEVSVVKPKHEASVKEVSTKKAPVKETTSLLNRWYLMVLGAASSVALLAVAAWLFLRNRRNKSTERTLAAATIEPLIEAPVATVATKETIAQVNQPLLAERTVLEPVLDTAENQLNVEPLVEDGDVSSDEAPLLEDSAVDSPMDFDLSSVNLDLETSDNAANNSLTDDISFDLDETVPSQVEDVPTETVANLSFDLPSEDEASEVAIEPPPEGDFEAQVFDLSGISLDLDDAPAEPVASSLPDDLVVPEDSITANPTQNEPMDTEPDLSPESQDAEIKFDLVSAYMDMDDKEGARELLEEIIKEGGPRQQLRAQQLLVVLS